MHITKHRQSSVGAVRDRQHWGEMGMAIILQHASKLPRAGQGKDATLTWGSPRCDSPCAHSYRYPALVLNTAGALCDYHTVRQRRRTSGGSDEHNCFVTPVSSSNWLDVNASPTRSISYRQGGTDPAHAAWKHMSRGGDDGIDPNMSGGPANMEATRH